jgi:hypothetical protein
VSRSKLRGVGLTLVTLLFLTACGSDTADGPADPDPTPQPTETAPDEDPTDPADADPTLPEMTVMRMANVAYFGPEYIAIDQGFDKKYNLTIEILQAASLGVPGIQAVAAGQAETFQSVAFDSWMKGLAAGVDLTGVISGQISGGDFDVYRYYVRADSGIQGPEDLVGKTMGIAAVGSYGDVPMDLYLRAAGIDPSSVERLAVPPGEIPNALATGQIDIAAAFSNIYAVLDADYADETTFLFADKDVLPVDVFVTSYGFSTAVHPGSPRPGPGVHRRDQGRGRLHPGQPRGRTGHHRRGHRGTARSPDHPGIPTGPVHGPVSPRGVP